MREEKYRNTLEDNFSKGLNNTFVDFNKSFNEKSPEILKQVRDCSRFDKKELDIPNQTIKDITDEELLKIEADLSLSDPTPWVRGIKAYIESLGPLEGKQKALAESLIAFGEESIKQYVIALKEAIAVHVMMKGATPAAPVPMTKAELLKGCTPAQIDLFEKLSVMFNESPEPEPKPEPKGLSDLSEIDFSHLASEGSSYFVDAINFTKYPSLFTEQYLPILVLFIFATILASIIFGASVLLAKQAPETEKLSSYECGFDPFEDARNTFDVRFYLVAILFIIFDLEAMFMFPWCISLSHLTSMGFWTMIDFLVELGIGFIYAWRIGALEWE